MSNYVNHVVETELKSNNHYSNPSAQVVADVKINDRIIPAFYDGDNTWKFRFSADEPGKYEWVAKSNDNDINGCSGIICVEDSLTENNDVYLNGKIHVSKDGNCFINNNGEPWLLLMDNWSMAMSKRLSKEDLKTLIKDRKEKGFSAVMLDLGQFPDMMPFDPRSESEAGFPWDEGFTRIREEYYKEVDKRIDMIVEGGLVPFIVGTWGHLVQFANKEFIKLHWRNIIARYGAYPVIYAVAGEGTMMIHGDFSYTPEQNRPYREVLLNKEKWKEHGELAREVWTEVMKYVKETDPYGTPVSITPTAAGYPYPNYSTAQVKDSQLVDFEMIHNYDASKLPEMVKDNAGKGKPIVVYSPFNGESSSELKSSFWRYFFYGAAGMIYQNAGVYFVNSKDDLFGHSGHGCIWSFETLKEGMHVSGSTAVGKCAMLLKKMGWPQFTRHDEWIISPKRVNNADIDIMVAKSNSIPEIIAVGNNNKQKLFYIPGYISRELFYRKKPRLYIGDKVIKADIIDVNSFNEIDYGNACPDKTGEWIMHKKHYFYQPVFGDILLILDENKKTDPDEKFYPEDAMEVPQEDDKLLDSVARW